MKAHIEFLTESTGYIPGTIPPRYGKKELISKLGSDGVLILDGRFNLRTHIKTAFERLASHPDQTLRGFHIREGENFREGKILYTYLHRRKFLTVGECQYCDAERERAFTSGRLEAHHMMPSHDASPHCESGKRPHCTCDWCF